MNKTTTTVLAATAVGLVGDVVIYSLGQSKGKPFKLHLPSAGGLLQIAAVGIISGLTIDYIVKKTIG